MGCVGDTYPTLPIILIFFTFFICILFSTMLYYAETCDRFLLKIKEKTDCNRLSPNCDLEIRLFTTTDVLSKRPKLGTFWFCVVVVRCRKRGDRHFFGMCLFFII